MSDTPITDLVASVLRERDDQFTNIESALSAEVTRRQAAEAVVDAVLEQRRGELLAAREYRAKYSKETVETACNIHEHDGAFKCFAHKRKWGAVLRPAEPCKGWVKP